MMNILGLMSGSSLDGLDMAICSFSGIPGVSNFKFEVKATKLIAFPVSLSQKLSIAHELDPKSLLSLHAEFGAFLGETSALFLDESGLEVNYIASHGHTVFHNPEQGFTFQLGNGADIAFSSKRDTICDFRSSDIAAKGSGAPFAPVVDRYLFPNVDILVNLGGISNFSYKDQHSLIAFDISPCNQLLNYVAQKIGKQFDEDGHMAGKGEVIKELLLNLISTNELSEPRPRALDNSWVKEKFYPLLDQYDHVENVLRTINEFIVYELSKAIKWIPEKEAKKTISFAGGGVFNKFLMDLMREDSYINNCAILETSETMINFKEACLMALLGYLRVNDIGLGIESVTGASADTIGGCIYKAV